MTTTQVTNTFVEGENIVADEVNQNFTDLCEAIDEIIGGTVEKAKKDQLGNVINTYYEKLANVTSKGNASTPVYFNSSGVATPVTSLASSLLTSSGIKSYVSAKSGSSSSTSGYIKFSDGLIIQWGKTLMAGNGYNVPTTVSLVTNFAKANYCLTGTYRENASGHLAFYDLTTSGFTMIGRDANSYTAKAYVSWLAIGY